MPRTILNLTPHTVHVIEPGRVVEFPPSGKVARVEATMKPFGYAQHGKDRVRINRLVFGPVTDLPGPKRDTFYIVSAIVAQAARRDDLLVPFQQIRRGRRIIGCRALAQMSEGL